MEKIPTATEFLTILDERDGTMWSEDDADIIKAFEEFAEMHVKAALKAASEGRIEKDIHMMIEYGEWMDWKPSILNSYPLENIK